MPTGEHGSVLGRISPGNIDLLHRPKVRNPDGGYSTVRSISFSERKGGPEILIPTVVGNRIVSDQEAIQRYKKTGRHLGIFSSVEAADRYAKQLHKSQQRRYGT